jgi:hypothetical protein
MVLPLAVVLAVAVLALGVAPAWAGPEIDQAAATLRDDPVYVAPQADPRLSAAEERGLEQHIASADAGAVYVAVLPRSAREEAPGNDPDGLPALLHEALGEPGTYAVVSGSHISAGSTELPRGTSARLVRETIQEHRGEGLDAILTGFVDGVAAERRSLAGGGGDRGSDGDGGGGGGGGLVLLGLLAAGGGVFAVSRARRRRRQAAETAEHVDDLRRAARDDLVALGDDVRAIDVDVDMPDADPRAREALALALQRYEDAETALDRARRPEDFAPITSALEEGRWAMEAAKARLEGREPPERRPPCFFDPRHGPSVRDVEWAPPGGEPRPVPVCAADAVRIESGQDPQTREVLAGGRRVPYYDAPGYFGPWAGGYFGGFGPAFGGFLPGLLFGSVLSGGAFGPFGGDWGDGGDRGEGGDFGGGGGDFGGGGDLGGGGDFGGGDFGGGGGDF